MTGLNLETFLHLLRADLGAWATLGLIAGLLALMAWTSWGSRRALRKCLVLSVMAHVGLALYGGTVPVILLAMHPEAANAATHERIQQIKVLPTTEPDDPGRSAKGRGGARGIAPWDKSLGGLALADRKWTALKTAESPALTLRPGERAVLNTSDAAPEGRAPKPAVPEARAEEPKAADTTPAPPRVAPGAENEVAPAVVAGRDESKAEALRADARLRAEPAAPAARAVEPSGRLPGLAPPLAEPSPTTATEAVAARAPLSPTTAAGAPAPPALAEVGDRDVAPVDVIRARPDSPRLVGGDVSLRPRSKPGAGAGGVGIEPRPRPRPLARSPLTLALPSRPGPALEGPTGDPIVDRPVAREGLGPVVAGAPASPLEGEVARAEVARPTAVPLPRLSTPGTGARLRSRPRNDSATSLAPARRSPSGGIALALPRVTPHGVPALPDIQGAAGGRPLSDVPEVYRSRLDPNRSARAFRSGASPASEQAVERALDWLARHQDIDGRWDGSTAKYDDGTVVKGDDDFTVHCPPGETCFGECIYWEADTALTGLALLSYLGAGYTQTDGKYAETVGKGLDFLVSQQKPDGDLRGRSRAVGMYCHAMATIALCEAYALTGDERLRPSVERAVDFLARSRARDGLAWRYAPGASVGDTSILGWVVMALKSAREVGIVIPTILQSGTLGWLSKVSSGPSNGLARYQPQDAVTPTMTAEAWVCRQFLGVGGPGAASSEASDYLLSHGPRSDQYNLYYWYYGTLAMYQHGGDAWYRWNGQVRDEIVRRQRPSGHSSGSWDPDDSPYGAKGGRVYCTALATLTLEVYYRYLRLYDEPNIPPAVAPARPRDQERTPPRSALAPAPRR